jgi:hypothetical protein
MTGWPTTTGPRRGAQAPAGAGAGYRLSDEADGWVILG